MLKKKTTVVIDHQAEEQAKQQAIQAELDALKPKAKSPVAQLQDTSVETNRSSLKKIKKSTLKTIGLVVLACAIISLLTWSILHKNYLDQQEKERVAKEKAERVAVEKADDALAGILSESDQDTCHKDHHTTQAIDNCNNQQRSKKIDTVLQKHGDSLPALQRSLLIQQKIKYTNDNFQLTSDAKKQQLDQIFDSIRHKPVTYRAYLNLAESYVALGETSFDKAFECYRLAKTEYDKLSDDDKAVLIGEVYFPQTRSDLDSLRSIPLSQK